MKVILLEKVRKLGDFGATVDVKNGYARNFLLPTKKALRATSDNRKFFDAKKSELAARNSDAVTAANATKKKLRGLSVIVIRQASDAGQLFGSVRNQDIAEKINEKGFKEIIKNHISLSNPIKELGTFEADVNLHPEVTATVTVIVAKSEAEAEKIQSELESETEDKSEEK